MPRLLHVRIIVSGLVAASVFRAASKAVAQSARQALGATPVVLLTSEPPAKIIIDQPLAEPPAVGWMVIQYRVSGIMGGVANALG
jgi:hypothetical protein